jgi:5,10-methylenetetrahydromethanopterin reductase
MSAERSTGWALWLHGLRPVPELVELARLAEDLGASALLLADEGVDRDIYVTLTAVAGATERLLLVPAITNPHSRHPVATAAALASLAEVAPGRVIAGLGAGGNLVFGPMGLAPARPYTALEEAVGVIDRLLAGETVDHDGEFTVSHASLEWAPGRLPLAIAGRGRRVESLAAQRADWILLAGKPVDEVPGLVSRLRSGRDGNRPAPVVVWNPAAAWRPDHVSEVRAHFAYMTVDLPLAEREALGITDEHVEQLRHAVQYEGLDVAARLVPDVVLERYSTTGSKADVIRSLSEGWTVARPDLVAFSAHEYSAPFVEEIAEVATLAGLGPAGLDAP